MHFPFLSYAARSSSTFWSTQGALLRHESDGEWMSTRAFLLRHPDAESIEAIENKNINVLVQDISRTDGGLGVNPSTSLS